MKLSPSFCRYVVVNLLGAEVFKAVAHFAEDGCLFFTWEGGKLGGDL